MHREDRNIALGAYLHLHITLLLEGTQASNVLLNEQLFIGNNFELPHLHVAASLVKSIVVTDLVFRH